VNLEAFLEWGSTILVLDQS